MPELTKSPLADDYAAQGVTLAEYHGALVPARFSDAVVEHRAVRVAAGIFDFSFRSKFSLKGEHRVRFLHRIVSNDIKSLAPGQGTYATLLNAQGHILVDFLIYVAEDEILVDTDADLRDKAMQSLQRYIIGDRVTIEQTELFAVSVQGPKSRELLITLGVDSVPEGEHRHAAATFAGTSIRVVRATNTGEEGYEVWVEPEHALDVWKVLRAEATHHDTLSCGTEALESLRIEAGIPRYGAELGEDTLPIEANLYNALSFTKGCYIGQEIVERARSRGHVNWKLVGLLIDGEVPATVGEKILAQGKAVGEVTSACVSPTIGKPVALAYARREISEPGTKLTLASGLAVEVANLPFYHRSAPEAAHHEDPSLQGTRG